MILIAAVVVVSLAAGRGAQQRWPERMPPLTERMLSVMVTVLMPIIVFFNVNRIEFDSNIVGGILLGWIALILTGVLASFVGKRLLGLSRPQTGALINSCLQPNSSFLGLPIAGTLLGADAITVAVGYDAIVVAPVLIIGVFGVAAAYGTKAGDTPRERVRTFLTRNPPLLAAVAGLLAPAWMAPDIVIEATRIAIYAQLPAGLFAVGVILTGAGQRIPPPMTVPVAASLIIRCVVAPLLLYLLALPLIELPAPYLVLAAMSPGLMGVAVAQRYGLDVAYQSAAVVWGTLLVVSGGIVLELLM